MEKLKVAVRAYTHLEREVTVIAAETVRDGYPPVGYDNVESVFPKSDWVTMELTPLSPNSQVSVALGKLDALEQEARAGLQQKLSKIEDMRSRFLFLAPPIAAAPAEGDDS